MAYHPLNLILRFILELACLLVAGLWSYRRAGDSYMAGIGLPVALMVIWAVFAVPEDRSRSGNAPVPIPGILRLFIELTFFGFGTWAIYDLGEPYLSLAYGIAIFFHYLISYERITWLIKQ